MAISGDRPMKHGDFPWFFSVGLPGGSLETFSPVDVSSERPGRHGVEATLMLRDLSNWWDLEGIDYLVGG